MKYAIVKDGIVVNLIEYAEQPTTPPAGFEDGHIAIEADNVSIGWSYVNGTFTDPNPPTSETSAPISLTDMIMSNPTELTKLKQALGLA
jgi:hypothetical protein